MKGYEYVLCNKRERERERERERRPRARLLRDLGEIFGAVLCFLVLFGSAQYVLQAKWEGDTNSYARVRLFYKQEQEPDVVFVGSSQIYYNINPVQIFQERGFTSYDFAPPHNGGELTEFFVEEVFKTCTPKVIVIDALNLAKNLLESEITSRQWLDPIPFSLRKLQAIKTIINNGKLYDRHLGLDSWQSYVFPLLRYHSRWETLSKYDFVSDAQTPYYHGAAYYHGYGPRFGTGKYDLSHYYDDFNLREDVVRELENYFTKIVKLCDQHGTELVVIKTPAKEWRKGQHDLMNSWAEEKNIPFLDYNLLVDEIGIVPEEDFINEGHLNDNGTTKLSRALGEYLAENYDLPDHRGDPAYADWDYDWQVYQQDRASWFLSHETDWASYLEKLKDPNYTVYIAARDNIGGGTHPELTEQLKTLGLTPKLDTAAAAEYIGILDGGEVVYEQLSDEPLMYETEINGHHVSLASESILHGNRASIQLDWTEKGLNRRGLNIVVYDNLLEDVVDRVTFDLWDGGKVYR